MTLTKFFAQKKTDLVNMQDNNVSSSTKAMKEMYHKVTNQAHLSLKFLSFLPTGLQLYMTMMTY